jgi:hypothetical protein
MEKAKAQGSLRGRRRSVFGCGVEELERRACPAAISIANVALSEGTNASPVARFTVSLSGKATTPVAVNWMTVDGTATVADNDFLASSGTIVFARGQTSKTVSVYIRGDAIPESDESFSVRLSNAVGATISKAMGTATIRNDDVRQSVVPSLSVSDVDLPERNGGRSDARFTVKLSAATNVPVTVNCATANGTATIAGSDYVATSSKLTFAPGETEKTVAVAVLGDSRIELDETFGLVLSNPRGATIAKATGTATIRNDDFSPPSPVLVTVLGSSVIEGDGDPGPASFAAFTVKLSRAADSAVTVAYQTYDGSATAIDNDYVATTGNLTFAVGETTKTILVPVVGDTKPERDETFSLVLVSAEGALLERTPARATVIDDDTPPELTVVGVSLPEGNTGSSLASFVISLNRPWTKPVDVTYATRDGSATTADSDYVAARGTVTFGVGEIVKTVSVSVIGDTRAEIDERFFLDLSSANNATIAEGTGTVTIVNDDSGDVPGFQITVDFNDPTLPDSTKQLVRNAADRWSQIITGDLPAVTYNGRVIDDFLLDVTVKSLDPSLLGGATYYPDSLRPGPRGLPSRGFAEFNSMYMDEPGIYYTILHEMAHALGFNSDLWRSTGFGLVSGWGNPGSSNPVFTGVNATREFNAYFGTSSSSVPLDDVHGAGSYGTHWRESVFGASKELMTYAWNVQSTQVNPISKVTIGAMADIGYTVNYAAADPYRKPSGNVLPGGQAAAVADTYAAPIRSSSSAPQSRTLGGAVTPNQSARKVASQLNGSTISRRTLTLDAAAQAGLATSAQWVESAKRATAKTPRERMFVDLAAGMASASERPLSTLAWRALGPA